MKTKKILGLMLMLTLVLTGCASSVPSVDGKDVVASIDGKDFFADDIYDTLSNTAAGKSALFSYMLDQLVTATFPVTSDMKAEADEIVDIIVANYENDYGSSAQTQLESALAYSGYSSMDDYRDALIYSLQYSEFIKKYVKDNFDEVFNDYFDVEAPRIVSIIKISMTDVEKPTDEEQDKLDEVKNLLTTSKSFGEIAKEYSDDSSNTSKGNIGVIDSTSNLSNLYGSDVEKEALSLKAGEVSGAIKGTDGYYFINCTSTDKDVIKSELKSVDIDSPLLVYNDYIIYDAFNTYEITFHSDEVKAMINDVLTDAENAKKEEREGNS